VILAFPADRERPQNFSKVFSKLYEQKLKLFRMMFAKLMECLKLMNAKLMKLIE